MPEMHVKLFILIVFLAAAVFTGCSSPVANGNADSNSVPVNSTTTANTTANTTAPNSRPASYPQSTVDAFLKSCQGAGSDLAFCTCVLNKVQANYTFEEFAAIETKMAAGSPPQEFLEFTGKTRAECTK